MPNYQFVLTIVVIHKDLMTVGYEENAVEVFIFPQVDQRKT